MSKKTNTYNIKNWTENNCCPYCNSNKVWQDELNYSSDRTVTSKWSCDCGKSWQETYSLTTVHINDEDFFC